MSTPYADEAFTYYNAGWRGVLPLPARAKTPPPSGFTGWAGVETTHEHVAGWVTDSRLGSGNIGLHFGDGLYGLDVDAYDDKDGAAALAELVARCGPLPATWTVTSRDDGTSGIRAFRATLPAGRVWLNEPGGSRRGIESVHRGHRYAVVWPSIHPKTGRKYVWHGPDGLIAERVPNVAELPELPAVWIEALTKDGEVRSGSVAGHDEAIEAVNGWRVGKPCHCVAVSLGRALEGMARPEADALHPAAADSLWNLVNYGHEGHVGVREALGAHLDRFVAARVESGRGEGEAMAQAEWWRMVLGAVGKLRASGRQAECICVLPPATPVEAPAGFLEGVGPSSTPGVTPQAGGRIVDLGPYLDGTFEAPAPTVGGQRDDMRTLLYSGKWHSLIAPTASGKSWWALWHVAAELLAGNRVIYGHFEESSPAGTIGRLLQMGVSKDVIRQRLTWVDCGRRWAPGEFARVLEQLRGPFAEHVPASGRLTLLVLDGINAACGKQQWAVKDTEAVTEYRGMFVDPATAAGIAVLSLGHPPKARGREDERHGFGSTAWLDEVDGVGFRLTRVKDKPLVKGATGMSILHSVKDRYGEVERVGISRESDFEGWVYLGAFLVNDEGDTTKLRLSVPRDEDAAEQATAPETVAAQRIVEFLRTKTVDGAFRTQRLLEDEARAVGLGWDKKLTSAALAKLRMDGTLMHAPELGTASASRLVAEIAATVAGTEET